MPPILDELYGFLSLKYLANLEDTVLHGSAGVGDVELISFFMGYGVEASPKVPSVARALGSFNLEVSTTPRRGFDLCLIDIRHQTRHAT